jgi:putative ABC transport system substrate-binding protein
MQRRDFLGVLGGAAATWPLAARAQQPAMPVIGLLMGGSPGVDDFRPDAVRQGLKAAGYVERQNIAIEYRWAHNQYARLPALAADLVDRRVAVIVALGNGMANAAKASTTTIPIVFQVGFDPVQFGFVASLARPNGNLTGVTFLSAELSAKQVEVLHETVPKAEVIGLLVNPTNPGSDAVIRDAQAAANTLGQKLVVGKAIVENDIEPAFAGLVAQRVGALLVRSDVLFDGRTEQIVALAAHYALPTIYGLREFVVAGGLMSYGASLHDALRQVGVYTGRILKGEKPADLPVQQSTKVELIINLKTAKALGLDIPATLLGRADQVIE